MNKPPLLFFIVALFLIGGCETEDNLKSDCVEIKSIATPDLSRFNNSALVISGVNEYNIKIPSEISKGFQEGNFLEIKIDKSFKLKKWDFVQSCNK